MEKRFSYGGQAVIEGVMIRGKHYSSIGVRNPGGDIILKTEPLSSIFTGKLRQFPSANYAMTALPKFLVS